MASRTVPDPPYASFVDLFTGVLLIFLIVIALLAIKQNEGAISDINQRGQFIEGLTGALSTQGMAVEADRDGGTLRIKDTVLFTSGSAKVEGDATDSLRRIAHVLRSELACHVDNLEPVAGRKCTGSETRFSAVMIEGHTDSRPVHGGHFKDNWDLSAARASATLRELFAAEPDLGMAKSGISAGLSERAPTNLFAVAGYADSRPASLRDPAKNRRIEVRFILNPDVAFTAPPEKAAEEETQSWGDSAARWLHNVIN